MVKSSRMSESWNSGVTPIKRQCLKSYATVILETILSYGIDILQSCILVEISHTISLASIELVHT